MMTILEAVNPATGEHLDDIQETAFEEVELYYHQARTAFEKWSTLAISERLNYLTKLRSVMVENMDQLAQVIVQDTGKVPTEALVADIMPTLDAINTIVKHAEKILSPKRVKTPLLLIGKKSFVEYMPRGVVPVISPWNYPLQLAVVPVISALAGGNTVILKPSEVTPLVGKYIEEMFQKTGFPKDVIQVAHGGKEVGAALTKGNPDYIFFTGSVRTGRIIQEVAAKKLIPTTLELGGKDPFIVFQDANLKRAAKGAVWGAFTNSGQVCMSAERIYVEESIYDDFLNIVKEETEKLIQGTNEDSDIGSMTFPKQKEIVKHHVKDALEKGAVLVSGSPPENWDDSMFIQPIILANLKQDMEVVWDETFGPVMPIIPFKTEEEVIKWANESNYGLNASVWTSDLKKARRVAGKLVTGAVTINEVLVSVANHYLPFGGTKDSGIGRYHSDEGLKIFCHEKAIILDKGKLNKEIQWYPYKGKYAAFLKLFQSYFHERTKWIQFLRSYLKLLKK